MNFLLALTVFLPLAVAVVPYALGKKRKTFAFYTSFIACALVFVASLTLLVIGKSSELRLIGLAFEAVGFEYNSFNAVLVTAASFMWLITTLFSKSYFERHGDNLGRYYFFTLITLGSTIGVFLASDFITLLTFFEIMSLASFVWVIHDETEHARKAAYTYLTIAIIGGLCMLFGLFIIQNELGTLSISALKNAKSDNIFLAGVLLLVGFGAKAGMFPLHIWLPKSHPVAPAPASALLSGILTKTGVYGAWITTALFFVGDERWMYLVLGLGVITMVLGAVMALLATNIKRILACSSMSQIGFITTGLAVWCGLGEEGTIAARGVLLHMLNHSSIKLLLFICAGVFFMCYKTLELNELKGCGRSHPLLAVCFAVGALGISGIPMFNGYISKTLLHEGIVELSAELGEPSLLLTSVEWLFMISGGLTLAYMTKLFVALFIEKGTKKEKQPIPFTASLSVVVSALAVFILGLFPSVIADGISGFAFGGNKLIGIHPETTAHYFSLEALSGAGITVLIGAAVYLLIVRRLLMKNGEYRTVKLFDLEDGLYKPVLAFLILAVGAVTKLVCGLFDGIVYILSLTIYRCVKAKKEPLVGTKLTYNLGKFSDRVLACYDRIKGNEVKKRHLALEFALKREIIRDTNYRISRNFSFALLMAGVGICIVLIYILIKVI